MSQIGNKGPGRDCGIASSASTNRPERFRASATGYHSACQSLGHLVKIALFGVAGFAFAPHLELLVAAGACVVAGTWLGSRILERVSERFFRLLYMGVLTAIALRLLAGEVYALHLSP